MIAQAGHIADLGFPVHPHQLRHSCGFKLANDKQDTRAIQLCLGHRNIQHTVQYTALAAGRFHDFWRMRIKHSTGTGVCGAMDYVSHVCET